MRRMVALMLGLSLGALAAITIISPTSAGYNISCWGRSDASNYGYSGRYEGYEWGGGWWDNNNQDNTPGCPADGGSSCEGPDCSGFVFKSWAMVNSSGNTGHYYWYIGDTQHGPYSSTNFRDGCSGACYDVCGSGTGSSCGPNSYSATIYMDAFAYNTNGVGHVGLIWQEDSGGYDWILEALNNSAGVGIWLRDYRTNPAYDGIRRQNWLTCPGG